MGLLYIKNLPVFSIPFLGEMFSGDEAQGSGVHAVAKPCWSGTNRKEMSKVRVSMLASYLRPRHSNLAGKQSIDQVIFVGRFLRLNIVFPSGPQS